jgi:hypothetical protein
MPSTDMLKKLLEEFAEKEAHTNEEINVITQQIEDLEKRIVVSQQRLQSVSQDRAKVKTMISRYSGGEWLSASPTAAAAAAAAAAANPPAAIGAKRRKKEASAEESVVATPDLEQPAAKITLPSPRASSTRLKAMPDPTLPQPQPELSAQPPATSSPFRSEPAAEPVPAEEPARPSPNEPAFTFNSLFSSAPVPSEEVPPAPVIEEQAAAPKDSASSSGNWPTVPGPATQAPGPGPATLAPGPSPATLAPGPATLAPGPSVNAASAANALRSSFFSDDDDDDDMLSAQATPPAATPASNPFLKSMISGGREPQTDAIPAETNTVEADAAQPLPASVQEEASAQIADLDDEESDDTVKSINDALRGLFR